MAPPSPIPSIRPSIEQLLQQLTLLSALVSTLSDPAYRGRSRGASSIGTQVRHLLDHVRAILDAGPVVNYRRRRRGTAVERSRPLAILEIERLQSRVRRELKPAPHAKIHVIDVAGPSEALSESRYESTWSRELHFVVSHSVHHLALIRLMAENAGFSTDRRAGVAASTWALDRGESSHPGEVECAP